MPTPLASRAPLLALLAVVLAAAGCGGTGGSGSSSAAASSDAKLAPCLASTAAGQSSCGLPAASTATTTTAATAAAAAGSSAATPTASETASSTADAGTATADAASTTADASTLPALPPSVTDTQVAASLGLLAGIPQHGLTLGDPAAPVHLTVFADLQCPFCQAWEEQSFPTVVRDYVRSGKVSVTLGGLAFLGPDSETALRAVVAASQQGHGWELAKLLYDAQGQENSGWFTAPLLASLGARIPGLDVDKLVTAMGSADVTSQLQASAKLATQLKVQGTPSFAAAQGSAPPVLIDVKTLAPSSITALLDKLVAGSAL